MESDERDFATWADIVGTADFARLGTMIGDLASKVDDQAVRAQLSAAADVVANAEALSNVPAERAALEDVVRAALEDGDLDAALAAAATLTAFDRARINRVDWSAASGS